MKYTIKDNTLKIIPETPLDHYYLGHASAGSNFFIKENDKKRCVEYMATDASIIIRALADRTILKMIEEE